MAFEDDRIWLRPGQHVVLVEFACGPWRGREIASIEARTGAYADALRRIQGMASDELRSFAGSVTAAIRARAIPMPTAGQSPEDDSQLMGDLLLLGALREVMGEAVLREAGVARLAVLSPECADSGSGPWLTRIGLAH